MVKGKRLQKYVTMSWLMSGTVALLASLGLFLIIGYLSYFQEIQHTASDLEAKAQTVARRLSAELLIGPRGAPEPVTLQLAKEFGFADVDYGTKESIDALKNSDHMLYSRMPVPFLEDRYVLRVAVPKPSILAHFNFLILVIAVLIVALTVGVGLFLQTKYLHRHLIRPIEALVETSTGNRNIPEGWPIEIQEISQKLNDSFQERERVVYSNIARGVIHDIKTILQSLKVATDLAEENPSEVRLNNLLKVSKGKLPSLLELVNTTLDGSREITVNEQQVSITDTLNKSIETVRMLAVAKDKKIEVDVPENLNISHDSVQLERVFTNLFKNGLESIEAKGSPDGLLKVSYKMADKDFVSFAIEDNGEGLPANPESVFRLLKSTKQHGSGLGLLVSRKIVEAHGGKIVAGHSREMGGAKFEVILPKGESKWGKREYQES